MPEATEDVQPRVDQLLADLAGDRGEEEAVYILAVLVNRAATELHRRVRSGANERRGDAAWGTWAALQNVARSLVLQSSTSRDQAAALVGRKR